MSIGNVACMSSAAVSCSIAWGSLIVFDDRAFPDHRVALEIHLGDQPLAEGVAEDREVDMGRPPVVAVRSARDRGRA
jgi:hypothetical protein